MKHTSHLRTEAWLLWGLSTLPGELALANGRFSYTAFGCGNFWPAQLRRLEADSGRAGLAQRLDDGEQTVLFDVPLTEVQDVHFPWFYFSGGMKLTVSSVRYRFGFDRPANARAVTDVADLLTSVSRARHSGRAWRAVLLHEYGHQSDYDPPE